MSEKSDLTKVAPPKELTDDQYAAVFKRLSRHLAAFRNRTELYSSTDTHILQDGQFTNEKDEFLEAVDKWTQETLRYIWLACREPGGGTSVPKDCVRKVSSNHTFPTRRGTYTWSHVRHVYRRAITSPS